VRRAAVLLALLALAGCAQNDDAPQAESTGTVTVAPSSPEPTPTPTTTEPTTAAPTPAPTTRSPKPQASGPGDTTFCGYLEQTAGAQQQVEDPAQFVALVEGAQAVAPGAIAEDLALYVQSVRKLALTVTGSPEEAQKADRWLARNDAAVQQAQANVDSYSQSACGRPFITGEG
jgi:hypothetical protein